MTLKKFRELTKKMPDNARIIICPCDNNPTWILQKDNMTLHGEGNKEADIMIHLRLKTAEE